MKKPEIYSLLIIVFAIAVGFNSVAADQTDTFRARCLKDIHSEDHRVSAQAMFNMGQTYWGGNEPADYVRAYMWYTLSVARHKPDAWYAIRNRNKIISRMTPQQIEKAEHMARRWMQAYWGQTPVSIAEADIKELQQRIVNGDDWVLDEIIRRAEFGDQEARIEFGTMYWEGIAVKSNPDKALYWWTRAAEEEDAEIMTKLGILYSNGHPGKGVAADPRKGEIWLLRAATKGYTAAAYLLTIMYREGKDPVRADIHKYRYWYHKWAEAAARNGDFSVVRRLAGYYSGSTDREAGGVWPKDPAKAAELSKMATSGDLDEPTSGSDRAYRLKSHE